MIIDIANVFMVQPSFFLVSVQFCLHCYVSLQVLIFFKRVIDTIYKKTV